MLRLLRKQTGPALPHLFQRRHGTRRSVISVGNVQKLLNQVLDTSGLKDAAAQPLTYTPHDFRRMFASEAVASGVPVHIAARVLGHHTVTTTETYTAVFRDDLIRSRSAATPRNASSPGSTAASNDHGEPILPDLPIPASQLSLSSAEKWHSALHPNETGCPKNTDHRNYPNPVNRPFYEARPHRAVTAARRHPHTHRVRPPGVPVPAASMTCGLLRAASTSARSSTPATVPMTGAMAGEKVPTNDGDMHQFFLLGLETGLGRT
ncbi:tyrosine-type recombinase/integrase [Mycolicibacterium fluoranthenivorans]|uniref:tyrosine-type recombinase/integrase n=1 Tax=Mycolicibacterium fluoranthenivorans TaxID=258505 RepID=UPI002E2BA031|nr:tyrosine-type recombinase/integrase [Mycolicibacterium fluoranthenivorans]